MVCRIENGNNHGSIGRYRTGSPGESTLTVLDGDYGLVFLHTVSTSAVNHEACEAGRGVFSDYLCRQVLQLGVSGKLQDLLEPNDLGA